MRLATALVALLAAVPTASAQVELAAPWQGLDARNAVSFVTTGDTLFVQGEVVGNQDDIEVSTDAGETVTEVDLDDVAGFDVDTATRVVPFGDRYYVGASGVLFRTTPGDPTSFAVVEATWDTGAPVRIRALFADGDSLVAHTTGAGTRALFSSRDGVAWTRLAAAADFANVVAVVDGLVVDGGNVFDPAATRGFKISTDGGATFDRVAAFPDDHVVLEGDIHAMSDGVVWATAFATNTVDNRDDTFLYRSLDGGATWADVTDLLPVGPLAGERLKDTWRFAEGTGTRLYVTANPYQNEDAAVYFTDDGAQTWKRVGPAPKALFRGFEVDGGTTRWAEVGDFYVTYVNSDAGSGPGRLASTDFAPTDAEGGGGTSAARSPGVENLGLAVAPNPVTGSAAAVRFELAASGPVSVDVVDVLGRRVATVHDGPLVAGAHRLDVAVGSLAPGSYLVRVRTARGVASGPFVVVR